MSPTSTAALAAACGAGGVAFLLWLRRRLRPQPRPPQHLRTTPKKVPLPKTGRRYVVTGGHGFLGSHVVEALLARGETQIVILDVVDSHLFAAEREQGIVRFIQGSVADPKVVQTALEGADSVLHVASIVDWWSRLPHQLSRMAAVNTEGTRVVVEAAKKGSVKRLVSISSASVVFDGTPFENITEEDRPLCTHPFVNHYVETKTLAEPICLKAHGPDLLTGSIRPGGLYGPRGPICDVMADPWSAGIGRKDNTIDWIYVENVCHGALLLEQKLEVGAPCGGKAFYITNDETPGDRKPTYYEFNVRWRKEHGLGFQLIPTPVVWAIALFVELLSRFRLESILPADLRQLTPPVLLLSRSTWTIRDDLARKLLGYAPVYTQEEGIVTSAKYWKKQHEGKEA